MSKPPALELNQLGGAQLLSRNMEQLFQAIELCRSAELISPALILIYSAIDIASALDGPVSHRSVKARFTAWVERYLLAAKPLPCTALDLYGARCGLVHTFIGSMTPPIWLDAYGRPRPMRACWTCGREVAPMRFRAGDLRPHGWRPLQTLHIPDWCGCTTEYVPVPAGDSWWQLVPIWDPGQTVNPLRRYGPPEPR